MNIKLIARKFTDLESWILHGVDPKACRDEFKRLNKKRANLEIRAAIQAEKQGHSLFANWTAFGTNRCRKCGMTIELHNIIDKTDAPDVTGSALTTKCNVNFCGTADFSKSDAYLFDVNENKLTTII